MLYERWRTIARERHAEPALRESGTGRCWTFGELFAAGETRDGTPGTTPASSRDIAFPRGHSVEFILELLAAWRRNCVVCPLETGSFGGGLTTGWPSETLPPGIVHLKSTSATTGTARLVAFTAEQLSADAANIVAT